jgi:putative MATE family efflux protein
MFTKEALKKLIIPLIIEQILAVLVGMADVIMVARISSVKSIGEAAVAGVSLVDSINYLLIGLFSALATGGAVVTSQYLGHKDKKNACKSGEQLVISTLILSLTVMIVVLLFRTTILHMLFGKAEANVMANARIYMLYTAWSYPFIAVYNACAALFRSMGNSKISMKVSLLMNGMNIVGNAILLYGFSMGVKGAALATLISRIFASLAMYFLLRDRKNPVYIATLLEFRVDFAMIKRILHIGIPNGLENSVFQVGKILVQGIIAALGTSAITSNQVAANIGNIGTIPGNAISLALITIVGQCIGALDYDGVKDYTHKLMRLTYKIMAVLNLVIIILIPFIIKMYDLTAETAETTKVLIFYHCFLAILIWPMAFTLPNALRAVNDVKYTMLISMFSMWIWRIGSSYILTYTLHLGVLGIWIAMTIDWLFRAICFVYRFRKEKYRQIAIM